MTSITSLSISHPDPVARETSFDSIEAEFFEKTQQMLSSYSVYISESSHQLIDLLQFQKLKEVFYRSCKKETFKQLSIPLEHLSDLYLKGAAVPSKQLFSYLLNNLIKLSYTELEEIEKGIHADIKTFSIVDIRELAMKTHYYKSLVDSKILSESLILETPNEVQNYVMHLALESHDWDVLIAFFSDAPPDIVIPILKRKHAELASDLKELTAFIEQIKRMGKILKKRYALACFEEKFAEKGLLSLPKDLLTKV